MRDAPTPEEVAESTGTDAERLRRAHKPVAETAAKQTCVSIVSVLIAGGLTPEGAQDALDEASEFIGMIEDEHVDNLREEGPEHHEALAEDSLQTIKRLDEEVARVEEGEDR